MRIVGYTPLKDHIDIINDRGDWDEVRDAYCDATLECYPKVLAALASGDTAEAGRVLNKKVCEVFEALANDVESRPPCERHLDIESERQQERGL